ncbi:MAG: Asp-tRNA(Asn)/Glu-tRNA(Gln) amidotransferase subunit GatA [Chitinophagia bacterium]|nr:Asp-tRNA(Asn)/Glu-tRNA(Gln) amidotransferase subunit GatA [Chitinophagia bacterium]
MFRFTTIKDYHQALQANTTSCKEAVQYYLTVIRERAFLNAFLEVFEEEALQRAADLDQSRAKGIAVGPLHGVVVGIKDVISYQHHAVTASSLILSGYKSTYNATVIDKLLDAGAIIIGRQNCDEFAMGSSNENSAFGPVKNFIDPSRVPGGSSGGSAVAVQAGMCMVSLGSDTGGSVRQPADFCGIVGLKPTYGRVSRYGLIAYASSFDQIGILANSVDDAAITLEIISGKDDFDSTVSDEPVPSYASLLHNQTASRKIAYFRQALEHPSLDVNIREQIETFISKLIAAGYQVEPIEFEWLDMIVPAYYVLTTAEASSNLSRFDGVRYGFRDSQSANTLQEMYTQTRSKGFGKEVQRRILLGNFVLSSGYFDAYFTRAQQVRQLLVTRTRDIFSQYQAILLPTVPSTAFRLGEKNTDPVEMFLGDIYTVFANLVGIPGISLPLFKHINGLPFGLQLMTSHFDEVTLLRFSKQMMQLAQTPA